MDLRLYVYDAAKLIRTNTRNTGKGQHKFQSLQEVTDYVNLLRVKHPQKWDTQFVIIEFYTNYESKILTIL